MVIFMYPEKAKCRRLDLWMMLANFLFKINENAGFWAFRQGDKIVCKKLGNTQAKKMLVVLLFLLIVPSVNAYNVSPNVRFLPTDTNITFFIGGHTPNITRVYPGYIESDGSKILMNTSDIALNVTIEELSATRQHFLLNPYNESLPLILNTSGWTVGYDVGISVNYTPIYPPTPINSSGWVNYMFSYYLPGTTRLILCSSAVCNVYPPEVPEGTKPSDKFNMTITIYGEDAVTNIGDMEYEIYLENNNSYLVKGTLWTWIENNGEYHKQNMTVFCPAMSNKTIKFKTFLMLLPGKYELKAELLRDPTRIRDYAQLGFEAKSVTGFASTGLKLEPTEAILIMILIIMIVMVAFAILLFVTDFYKYLFSEPAPKQE